MSTKLIAERPPMVRWSGRARSLPEIETELARLWASARLTTMGESGESERHVAARTSVMNLVVVAGRPEIGIRAAALVEEFAGRHPSRTLILTLTDPDGPAWVDARIEAHCVMPRPGAPETCAETIHLTAGGESGRHLRAIVAPLLIHDLPVTVWWPGEPPLDTILADEIVALADRLAVDGSAFRGSGIARLRSLARLLGSSGLAVTDFALLRQSRWREAIASAFDHPDLLPFLGGIRAIRVTYGTDDPTDPEGANILKPVYHVAWLASQLGLSVVVPLQVRPDPADGFFATLRAGRRDVLVELTPVPSRTPPGTTLRVGIEARRGGSELEVAVMAHAEAVRILAHRDGHAVADRIFAAPRSTEGELLAATIEAVGRDPVTTGALRVAGALVGHPISGRRQPASRQPASRPLSRAGGVA